MTEEQKIINNEDKSGEVIENRRKGPPTMAEVEEQLSKYDQEVINRRNKGVAEKNKRLLEERRKSWGK